MLAVPPTKRSGALCATASLAAWPPPLSDETPNGASPGRVIHSASSQDTSSICAQRSLPSPSRNFLTVAPSRPGCAHTSRPLSWSTTTREVALALADRDLIDTRGDASPASRSRCARRLVGDAPADPADRPPRRRASAAATAVAEVLTASHATWSSNCPREPRVVARPRHRAPRSRRDACTPRAAPRPPHTPWSCRGPARANAGGPRPGHSPGSGAGRFRSGPCSRALGRAATITAPSSSTHTSSTTARIPTDLRRKPARLACQHPRALQGQPESVG